MSNFIKLTFATADRTYKGWFESKLHAVCDGDGRPGRLLLTAGNVSDIVGARELMKDFTGCGLPIGDKGYDADWFRKKLRQTTWGETVHSSAMPPQNPVALRHRFV